MPAKNRPAAYPQGNRGSNAAKHPDQNLAKESPLGTTPRGHNLASAAGNSPSKPGSYGAALPQIPRRLPCAVSLPQPAGCWRA